MTTDAPMGLLDLFFKTRPAKTGGRKVESRGQQVEVLPPDPTIFLVPRDRHPIVPITGRVVPPEPGRIEPRAARKPLEIVVLLSDVIARIPPEFLQKDAGHLRRELRFGKGEYFADVPRGRVTVALSNIARQCPEAFRVPITDDDDREVRLPLQKLLEQLVGSEPEPARPKAERSPRPFLEPLPAPRVTAEARPQPVETPAPVAVPAPAAETDGPVIQLSLAAILAGCPDGIFTGARPHADDAVLVSLPLEPIERQLASGSVEISAARFLALLPPGLATGVPFREGAKVPLPLEEIFRNLPGGRKPHQPHPAESPAGQPTPRPAFQFFSPAPTPAEPAAPPFGPPPARPLVVLPPPLADTQAAAPATGVPEIPPAAEPRLETTSDQAAVLEFLSEGLDPEPPR